MCTRTEGLEKKRLMGKMENRGIAESGIQEATNCSSETWP